MSNKKIPVLITTDSSKRGVFFGYIDPADIGKEDVYAEQVQMCVYWSQGVRGVVGLAANGPDKSSRVTAPAKAGLIKGVSCVLECSDTAVAAWQACPWG